jgi:hypothetical protein
LRDFALLAWTITPGRNTALRGAVWQVRVASRTHLRCASLGEISGMTGVFFDRCLHPATIVDNDWQETTRGADLAFYSLADRIQIEQ